MYCFVIVVLNNVSTNFRFFFLCIDNYKAFLYCIIEITPLFVLYIGIMKFGKFYMLFVIFYFLVIIILPELFLFYLMAKGLYTLF